MDREKTTAIVLAAGSGKRMGGAVRKQYMDLEGRPLLAYALEAFEESSVDEIVVVAGAGEVEYCQREIVDRYGYEKVAKIVPGGQERYASVYEGLKVVKNCRYVLIHDGARPCVTARIIEDAIRGAENYQACVVGMPVKDTIKIADEEQYAAATPDRRSLWQIQTPQAFSYDLIYKAYERLLSQEGLADQVTDDAMVVERMTNQKVKLIYGDYMNIKVTTPEDIVLAKAFLKSSYFR